MDSQIQKTGSNHYHAQLGLPDKGRAIKGLVVCYLLWLKMGLWTSAICVGLVPYCGQDGYRAQIPQHHILHNIFLHLLVLSNIVPVCLKRLKGEM